MEAKALEAERRQQWLLALVFYQDAAYAAAASGQFQKGLIYHGKALLFAEKTRDQERQCLNVRALANIHRTLRQYDKAREWTERGIEITKKLPAGPFRDYCDGSFSRDLGEEFLRHGELQKAIEYLSYSVQVMESRLAPTARSRNPAHLLNSVIFLAYSRSSLSKAQQQAGNIEEAINGYQRGLNLITQYKVKSSAGRSLYQGIGQSYLSQGDFPRALESLSRALALAESQRNPIAISEASRLMGNVYRQTGRTAASVTYFQKAIDQTESTRSLLQSEDFRQSYFEGALDAYVSLIGVLSESGKTEEAFTYSERARAFLDLLGSKTQLSRVKSGLLEAERTLQERIAAIKARASGEEDGETDRGRLGKELAAAEQAYNAFLAKVRSQDKEQASLMSVEPLALKQVQELLDPGQTLLEYFVTDKEVFIWAVEKDKLGFQRVALSKAELAKAVKNLRNNIATLGDPGQLREISTALYQQLIQPVLSQITGKELIVVPHDVLHYLPFQALQSPDGRYLIEKYPIDFLSSASLLQFTKEKRRAQGEKVLAFGNPDLNDPAMSLRYAEVEAKEIKNLYPQSTIYLEKDATEERAKALSPNNDIIHFASHAELSEDDPLSSAVLLAKSDTEDGRLEVREIFGMDLKANLVVLSACETGLGKLSSGDELVGLTRAFIYAGTPSVVASLWNVEDSSTAQLMASFYKNLKTMTKVEALRQAQLQLIRGNINSDLLARRGIGGVGKLGEVPETKSQSQTPDSLSVSTSHPYFWAPFILVGDGK